MAKKQKQQDAPKGSPAWMATFSDLMNLLLCFFVLLFSMSSVDAGKAEALIKSLSNTFSIFSGGGSSFKEGSLISNGADQLSQLDEYFSTMGQTADGDENSELNNGNASGEDSNPEAAPTAAPSDKDSEIAENKSQTGLLYEEIIGYADRYNLGQHIEVGVDEEAFEYVRIEVTGSVLFDSGEAVFRDEAKPFISALGDILKQYTGYRLEVIGHTDTVPMTNGKFQDNMELSAARAVAVARYLVKEKGMDERFVYYSGRGEIEPIASNDTVEGRERNRRVEIRLYNLRSTD